MPRLSCVKNWTEHGTMKAVLQTTWYRRTTGQIQCPLIGCRSAFDNLESCLAHLAECAWLSNAWYWCPFCVRPERFTAQDHISDSALKFGQSGGDPKPSPLQHYKDPKSKSGAVRFLKTVGGKLGFLQRSSRSQAFTKKLVSHSVANQPQVSQSLAGASITVADKQPSIAMEKVAPLRQDYIGAPFATVCEPGYPSRYSIPELEGDVRQAVELSGDQYTEMWYHAPAELPDHGYDRPLQQELLGSAASHMNTNHQYPSYKRWPLDYDRSPSSPSYSVDPSATVASIPLYALQGHPPAASPVGSLQNCSELEANPNMSDRDSFLNSAGIYNKMVPDHPMWYRTDASHQLHRQTSSMNEMRDARLEASRRQIQAPPCSSAQPQSTSSRGQPENLSMKRRHPRVLLGKDTAMESTPFASDQDPKHHCSTQRSMDVFSPNGPAGDGQLQVSHPSPREPEPSHRLQGVQNQVTSDDPPLLGPASSQEQQYSTNFRRGNSNRAMYSTESTNECGDTADQASSDIPMSSLFDRI
ncbi:MAG: hypothetical protein Q9216_002827 [Gyalolechia sp. 2 TL-2023]